jgi:hypothetical protein
LFHDDLLRRPLLVLHSALWGTVALLILLGRIALLRVLLLWGVLLLATVATGARVSEMHAAAKGES